MASGIYSDWIASAKVDLMDFNCNYGRTEYIRSAYYLQQATEKTFKAYMLRLKFSFSKSSGKTGKKIPDLPVNFPEDYGHDISQTFPNQFKKLYRNRLTKTLGDLSNSQE